MIDTLYLHIGAPKTGTTTLQNVLFEARQELRAHEVFFPDVAANHYFLASAFHQNPQNLLPNKLNGRTTTETLAKYHKENLGKVQEQATAKNWPYGILSTESLTILQHQGISNPALLPHDDCTKC